MSSRRPYFRSDCEKAFKEILRGKLKETTFWDQFLDIGCGAGDLTRSIVKVFGGHHRVVVATETSIEVVKVLRRNAAERDVLYEVMDIEKDVDEALKTWGRFRRIFSFYHLERTRNKRLALANMRELLIDNGELFLLFQTSSNLRPLFQAIKKSEKWAHVTMFISSTTGPFLGPNFALPSDHLTYINLIAAATCQARYYSYAARRGLTPPEVLSFFGGVAPSAGHGKRLCKILWSERWTQVSRHRDYLWMLCSRSATTEREASKKFADNIDEAEEAAVALSMLAAAKTADDSTITTDSRTAIVNYLRGRIGTPARKLLSSFRSPTGDSKFKVTWDPAHSSHSGNEAAHSMASRALSNRDDVATGWTVSGEHNYAAPPSGDFNTSFSEATRVYRDRRGTLPPPHKELTHQQARTWRRLQAFAIPTPRSYHKIYPHLFDGTCSRCTGPEDIPQPGSLEHMFWECPNFAPPEMLNKVDLTCPDLTSLGPAFNRTELFEAQQNDFCRAIFDRLRQEMDPDQTGGKTLRHSGTPRGPSATAQESDIEAGELESYLIDGDGVLLCYFPDESDSSESFKTVIPRDLRVAVLRHYHDADGHGSAPMLWHKLRRFATWPGMKGQLCPYIRSCAVCQERKPKGGRPPGLLQPIVSTRPWEIAACDLMGPLPRSSGGYQHVLVVTCHFTGFVEMFPMRKVTAKGVLSRLSEVWCRYRFPERLVSDNASIFCSKVFAATCQALGIKHCKTSCYHPQANVTERRNRDFKPLLGAYALKQRGLGSALGFDFVCIAVQPQPQHRVHAGALELRQRTLYADRCGSSPATGRGKSDALTQGFRDAHERATVAGAGRRPRKQLARGRSRRTLMTKRTAMRSSGWATPFCGEVTFRVMRASSSRRRWPPTYSLAGTTARGASWDVRDATQDAGVQFSVTLDFQPRIVPGGRSQLGRNHSPSPVHHSKEGPVSWWPGTPLKDPVAPEAAAKPKSTQSIVRCVVAAHPRPREN
ncbi:juvenile hormone acid O-methyltransferase-like [Ixodes scapularis]